jgi:hypothetical protein
MIRQRTQQMPFAPRASLTELEQTAAVFDIDLVADLSEQTITH